MPVVVGELAVEPVLEQLGAVEPGAPGPLLLGVEPARLARLRGTPGPCDADDTSVDMSPSYWRNSCSFNYATVEQKVKRSTTRRNT